MAKRSVGNKEQSNGGKFESAWYSNSNSSDISNSESNGTPNNVMPLPHALGLSNGKHKNRMIVQLVIESQQELKANR